MEEKHVHGTEEMADFADGFLAELRPEKSSARVIALSGELGAGKTTFTQAAARALGVEETVNSPTFVIQKIYGLRDKRWQKLVHIDAYRLHSAAELESLGWDTLVHDPNNLIIIEWPENVLNAIPAHAQRISIDIGDGDERTISYGN